MRIRLTRNLAQYLFSLVVYLMSAVCAQHVFVLKPEYCLPGHTLFNGKCYKLYLRGAVFEATEAACNKLNEGHLASYHSLEDYQFLRNLTKGTNDVWIGLREVDGNANNRRLAKFTDGSTHDYIPPTMNLDDPNACVRLVLLGLNDYHCQLNCSFICMSYPFKTQDTTTVVADGDLKHLFDDNPDTCMSTVQLLTSGGIYISRMNFTYTKNHGSINLKVTWNSDINCMRTKTLFTKQEGNNCNTLTPCPLVMDNDTLTSSCMYECPYDQNGCHVTYFESQLDYEDRTGDACTLQVLEEE